MENAIQMLQKDHDEIRDLFEKYERENEEKKKELSEEIFENLDAHMDLEEEIFYPAVENAGKTEMIAEAVAEHEVIKDLIEDLQDLDFSDQQYSAKFNVMRENVEHHLQEEESRIFDFAKNHLAGKLDELAAEMVDLKARF